MANQKSDFLYERIPRKNTRERVFDVVIFIHFLLLLSYRLHLIRNHGFSWLYAIAFLCELFFTFNWILLMNVKWNPVEYTTYPDRLSKCVPELPRVDLFVTTADPQLEPPIIAVNTVLSLLAADYPANKLACYVSDDGCSSLTFYSLKEAVKFAQIWVPFCKKYKVEVRAPFRYFTSNNIPDRDMNSKEFRQEWKRMKDEYGVFSGKIHDAVQRGKPCDLTEDFSVFSNTDRTDHPAIVKVLWENKEGLGDQGLPHLVYISREKRPNHPHHYKAGAMNVLTRVSGVMTNAPYMLNVDCDMFVNNPNILLLAMCVLLDPTSHEQVGFVQSPQCFYDAIQHDPFGNQMIVLSKYVGHGMAGLQGMLNAGTGCFHRRKVIYGLSPDDIRSDISEKISDNELMKSFGISKDLVNSFANALKGETDYPNNLSSSVEAANQVAGCGYEFGTIWGTKVGWIYGSTTEDVLTGLTIHGKGWRSIFCSPDPPGFLGCAPPVGPSSMTQQKRWTTGLLEILFGNNSPIFATLFGKLQLRQCLTYLWILTWGLRSIPELFYAALPAYCIITNTHFLPKMQEPASWIPILLFLICNLQALLQYLETNQSARAWWNNHRMARINVMGPWFFGFLSVVLKLLRLSEMVFEVTRKEQSSSSNDHNSTDVGRFSFDDSPVFIPGTTIFLVQLTALLMGSLGVRLGVCDGAEGFGLGEVVCSVWLVLCFWPFLRGMFGKGRYGIPLATIWKSIVLASLFVYLCIRSAEMG